jgi:hypothetical protein
MTIRDLLEENPELIDYTISLSQFFAVSDPTNDDEKMTLVTDYPILGIASNEDAEELRLIVEMDSVKLIKTARNKCIAILDQKLAEARDENKSNEDEESTGG